MSDWTCSECGITLDQSDSCKHADECEGPMFRCGTFECGKPAFTSIFFCDAHDPNVEAEHQRTMYANLLQQHDSWARQYHEAKAEADRLGAIVIQARRFIAADDAMSMRDWGAFEAGDLGAVAVEYEKLRDLLVGSESEGEDPK